MDLAGVVGIVALTGVVLLLPRVRTSPVRLLFAILFVLFVPGYAAIAALFPESSPRKGDTTLGSQSDSGSLDTVDRLVLSAGLSVVISGVITIAAALTPWGVRTTLVFLGTATVTIGLVNIAARRRRRLPPESRYQAPVKTWLVESKNALLDPPTTRQTVLNVLFVAGLLLAVGTAGYATLAAPQSTYTELYLLSDSGDGSLAADDYPTTYTQFEGRDMVVGVRNFERETVEYTLLVQLQRVQTENETTQVDRRIQLDRFTLSLAHNETWQRRHTVQPPIAGDQLRLTYLLYRGQPPAAPMTENAYRTVRLWIDVRPV